MEDRLQTLRQLRTGSGLLLICALAAVGASFWFGQAGPDMLILTAAVSLSCVVVLVHLGTFIVSSRATRRLRIVMDFLEHDSAPGFCTSEEGRILSQNTAAKERFGQQVGGTMTRALESLFANPDAVVHRLRLAAEEAKTGAREDVVTRRGHVRVAVHRMPAGYLWRLEDLVDRPKRTSDGLGLPILTFGASGTILYMNEVLRGMVGQRVTRLADLFESIPLSNGGLNRIMTKDGPQSARILLSDAVNGRQEVFVLPADEQPDDQVALDTLPVALLRLDANGSVIFANRLARDLLPAIATTSERRLAALVEGLGRSVREWVSEAAAGRGLYRAEVVRVTGAEVETYLQITLGRPVGDADGGLLAVVNDATELKTLEAQFVQSQKMQAIGQLAGGVAHDFNNLLTAISGHCDLLMLRHGEGDEDYADLTQITQNANRAAALVGQLLAFSRKQTLEMRPIDLRDTLGDLAHLLNRLVGERVILRLHHDPALIPIRGDRRQLEQVLMNLVVNARDAMPTGGEILISTECRYLDSPVRRDRVTVPSGQYVVVSVTDQGEGISPDNLSRIFEPFFTTKRPGEGTGLGLSMAYGIVKQSGGYIFADSPPGEGTQFSLFFPALGEESLLELEKSVGYPVPLAEQPHDMAISSDIFSASLDAEQENPLGPEDHEPTVTAPAVDDMAKDDAFDADPDEISADMQDDEDEMNQVVGMAPEEPMVDEPHSDVLKRDAPGNDGDTGENHAAGDDPDGDDIASLLDKVLSGDGEMDQSDDIDPVPAAEPHSFVQSQDKTPTASERSADWSETGRSRPVVLLVEDEAPVRAFASRALRLRGYEVHEAESAEAALAHLEDQTLNVDVFVTDVMMPGLDGPTWVRQAMKDRPDVRTIFISGYTQDALSETSVPVPNSVFLPKPFSLADLTRTVERALS